MNGIIALVARDGFEALTDSTLQWVANLAAACPYVEGSAVYKARALYAAIDPSINYDDQLICNSQGYFKNEDEFSQEELFGEGSSEVEEPLAEAFYSPASQSLVIKFDADIEQPIQITILNNLGQVMCAYGEVRGRTFTYDVDFLTPGLYLTDVRGIGTSLVRNKFVVIE